MMNTREYKEYKKSMNTSDESEMSPATDVSSIESHFRKLGKKLVDGCNSLGRYFGSFGGTGFAAAESYSAYGYCC